MKEIFCNLNMKFLSTILLMLIFILVFQNCIAHRFQSPYADQGISLEGWEKKCNSERTFPQWYLFWGAYPINKIDEKDIFPSKNKSYRLSQKTTWLDGTISALGGPSISLTRKTWVVEDCNLETVN